MQTISKAELEAEPDETWRMGSLEHSDLEARIGRIHLQQRLGLQSDYVDHLFGRGRTILHIENWEAVRLLLEWGLRTTRLRERGRRNSIDLAVERNDVKTRRLPRAFDGFAVLHLSDLHIDLNPQLAGVLQRRIEKLTYDVCVLTGDYRGQTHGPFDKTLRLMAQVTSSIQTDTYGILGNHDVLEMTPPLEEMGIRMLLNESVALHRNGERIFLCGVDDPHYFQLDNLEKSMAGIPADAFTVLLSHSPELYRRAAHANIDLMLCGHTHGGQICLPGGRPVIKNARCPIRLSRGSWHWRDLQGYTSRGAGASLLDVRFNCRPEVTLHRLRILSEQATA
jgi:predicted MPP superfamily phosphohydrolase